MKDPADLRAGLTWQRKDEVRDEQDPLLGCYVLRTDRSQLGQERLWELYVLLSRAEDGLSWLKGDLGLRPNFHHLEDRVDAHIFITVLAYQLLRYITYTLEQKETTEIGQVRGRSTRPANSTPPKQPRLLREADAIRNQRAIVRRSHQPA